MAFNRMLFCDLWALSSLRKTKNFSTGFSKLAGDSESSKVILTKGGLGVKGALTFLF